MAETSLGQLWISLGIKSTVTKDLAGVTSELSMVDKAASSVTNSVSGVGATLKTLGATALVTGTAIGAGLVVSGAKATSMFVDFEKSISNAASVTGLTGEAFKSAKENISAVAQELGQKTAFSSSQAADALYNLASAGIDVSKITSSQLVPVLNLASGTQYGLAETTAAVTSTLSQFSLGFDSAGRVADVFASAAGSTQANMEKLSLSMNYVGTISHSVGMSLEDTTAALGLLYNAGMDGSTAGTSLRGVLASLQSPTKAAATALSGMGISIDQVNPSTNKFSDIIQLLADKGLDANEAFKIFGRESAPAILALTSKSADLKSLSSSLQEAGGAAQTMADQQLDTLSGSLDSLSGSIENVMINIGQALAPTIRKVADSLTAMMPQIQTFVVSIVGMFVGLVSQLGPSVNAILDMGNKILKSFLKIMNISEGESDTSGIANYINSIFQSIDGIITSAAPVITGAVKGIIDFIKDIFDGLGPVWDNLSYIAQDLGSIFNTLFADMSGSASKTAADTIVQALILVSDAFTNILGIVNYVLKQIIPPIKEIFSGIVESIKQYLPDFGDIREELSNVFVEIPFILEDVVNKLTPVWELIKGKFNELKPILSQAITDLEPIWDKLKELFNKVPVIISQLITDLQPTWDNLKSTFESVKTIISTFVSELSPSWDNLKSSFGSIKTIIEEVLPSFASLLGSLSGPSTNDAISATKLLADAINIVTGAIASLLKWLADNPKVVEFSIAVVGLGAAFVTLVPIISGVIGAFSLIAGAISSVIGLIGAEGLGYAVGSLIATSFPGLASAILVVTETVLPALITGLGLIITPVGLIAIAVAALALAWATNWGGIRDKANEIWNLLVTDAGKLKASLETVYNNLGTDGEKLQTGLGKVWDTITSVLSTNYEKIKTSITELYTSLSEKYTSLKESLGELHTDWSTKWTDIQTMIETAITNLKTKMSNLHDNLSEKYENMKSSLLEFYNSWKDRWDKFLENLGTTKENVIKTVTSLKEDMLSKWDAIKSDVKDFHDKWATKWGEFVDKLGTIKTNILNKIEDIKTGIFEKWEKIKTGIDEKIQGIIDIVNGFATRMYDAGASMIGNLKDGIMDELSNLYDKALSKLNKINKLFPHSPAEEGPFSVLPNWDAVIKKPLETSISKMENSTGLIKSTMSRLSDVISSNGSEIGKRFTDSITSGLSKISDIGSVLTEPLMKSIRGIGDTDTVLQSPVSDLSTQKSPSTIASSSATSNNTTYAGDNFYITVNASSNLDIDYLMKQIEAKQKMKAMQGGYV